MKTNKTVAVEVPEDPGVISKSIIELLVRGAQYFVTAGELLCEAHKEHPTIYKDIIALAPWLTAEFLSTLERVGAKLIHQNVLMLPPYLAEKVIAYPYEQQKLLCEKGVEVVVSVKDGNPLRQWKPVNSLTLSERNQVLGRSHPRSPQEQVQWLEVWNQQKPGKVTGSIKRAVDTRCMSISSSSNEASKVNMPPPAPAAPVLPADLRVIGRWVIRQTIGNNLGFERTTAKPPDSHRIILDSDGIAVIEVCRRLESA